MLIIFIDLTYLSVHPSQVQLLWTHQQASSLLHHLFLFLGIAHIVLRLIRVQLTLVVGGVFGLRFVLRSLI